MEEYIDRRNGDYYVTGTEISLASVVHLYRDGFSPTLILHNLPLLGNIERIRGAIAFYLANRTIVDSYLEDKERRYEDKRANQPPLPQVLAEKLERAKEELADEQRLKGRFRIGVSCSPLNTSRRLPVNVRRAASRRRAIRSGSQTDDQELRTLLINSRQRRILDFCVERFTRSRKSRRLAVNICIDSSHK
jgi:uncharacterized protein (DUF433 family)